MGENKMDVLRNMKKVDVVKWFATFIQLIGYGLTGLNMVPYNIYLFFIGIFLWFAVGVMWKDKAIMVVHVGAFYLFAYWLFKRIKFKRKIYDLA